MTRSLIPPTQTEIRIRSGIARKKPSRHKNHRERARHLQPFPLSPVKARLPFALRILRFSQLGSKCVTSHGIIFFTFSTQRSKVFFAIHVYKGGMRRIRIKKEKTWERKCVKDMDDKRPSYYTNAPIRRLQSHPSQSISSLSVLGYPCFQRRKFSRANFMH